MLFFRYTLTLLFCHFTLVNVFASGVHLDFITPHTFSKPTAPNGSIPVALVINLEDGWHAYAPEGDNAQQAPKIDIKLPKGVTLTQWEWPPASIIKSDIDPNETFLGYTKRLVLTATLNTTDPLLLTNLPKASVNCVVCSSVCQFFEGNIALHQVKKDSFASITQKEKPTEGAHFISWWWIILYALLGGIILNLMPCVLPVLSLKVLGLIQSKSRQEIQTSGLAFSLGTFLSFWLMATFLVVLKAQGHAIGWGFQLQSPLFVFLLIMLFTALALNLFGVFEIGTSLIGIGQNTNQKSSFSSSFFSGVLAVIVASPCSAPFMGIALGYALTQDSLIIFMVMTALSLGFCLPFLLLCFIPTWARFLPSPGRWMISLRQMMGFAMFASVLWLLSVFVNQTSDEQFVVVSFSILLISIALWTYGRWGGAGSEGLGRFIGRIISLVLAFIAITFPVISLKSITSPQHIVRTLTWEPFSQQQAKNYQQAGKTVFIDFTASWCITCQWNKKMILSNEEVINLFEKEDVVPMRADWTNRDGEITRSLQKYGRNSIPTYVILKPEKKPIVLPEILSISTLRQVLKG